MHCVQGTSLHHFYYYCYVFDFVVMVVKKRRNIVWKNLLCVTIQNYEI
jgi:hypothetical protein